MIKFKPGDKVLVEATVHDANEHLALLKVDATKRYSWKAWFSLSFIHRNPTEELERLREYVELQPCFCQRGLVKLCDRCLALGKEKS